MDDVRLIKPYVNYDSVAQDFQQVFESGVLPEGLCKAVCKRLGILCGGETLFLTTSATTALWACLKALNIQHGDDVAISDFSFPRLQTSWKTLEPDLSS